MISGSLEAPNECCSAGDPDTEQSYDPSTQCCIPDGPGVNVRSKALSSQEDLGECPDRTAKQGYQPTSNGCGTSSGFGQLVPNDPASNVLTGPCALAGGGGPSTSFLSACNSHDICYGTCNSDKTTCDDTFYNDMEGVANAYLAAHGNNANNACYISIMQFAGIYHTAVSDGGESAYNDAQVAGCQCCE